MWKYWIILAVVAAVFIGGGWWFVKSQQQKLVSLAIANEKERVAQLVREKAREILTVGDFLEPNFEQRDQSFRKYWSTLQSPEYLRIKIWDSNYTLIWADLKEPIGQRFADNHEMEEALEGEIELELDSFAGAENEHERQFFNAAEVYVPIYDPTNQNVVGVVEVYKTAYFLDDIRQEMWKSVMAIGLVILTGLVTIAVILRKYFSKNNTVSLTE